MFNMAVYLFFVMLCCSWLSASGITIQSLNSMDFSSVDLSINKTVSRSRIQRRQAYMKEREARKEAEQWTDEDMDDFTSKFLSYYFTKGSTMTCTDNQFDEKELHVKPVPLYHVRKDFPDTSPPDLNVLQHQKSTHKGMPFTMSVGTQGNATLQTTMTTPTPTYNSSFAYTVSISDTFAAVGDPSYCKSCCVML